MNDSRSALCLWTSIILAAWIHHAPTPRRTGSPRCFLVGALLVFASLALILGIRLPVLRRPAAAVAVPAEAED